MCGHKKLSQFATLDLSQIFSKIPQIASLCGHHIRYRLYHWKCPWTLSPYFWSDTFTSYQGQLGHFPTFGHFQVIILIPTWKLDVTAGWHVILPWLEPTNIGIDWRTSKLFIYMTSSHHSFQTTLVFKYLMLDDDLSNGKNSAGYVLIT